MTLPDEWHPIVANFPLRVERTWHRYTRLTKVGWDYLHYTTPGGLEGILRSGGLRATYRGEMTDAREFTFARDVLFSALDQVAGNTVVSSVTRRTASDVKLNLERLLDDRPTHSSAYCACLSAHEDDPNQWDAYADGGKGFALVFDLQKILEIQVINRLNDRQFLYMAPVIYSHHRQLELVEDLINAGIDDFHGFALQAPNRQDLMDQIRKRITSTIFCSLYSLISFLKSAEYEREAELRLMFDPNNGSLEATNVEHFDRGGKKIPYLLMDLRDPHTGLMPLSAIEVGPQALFERERNAVLDLLDELGYMSGSGPPPKMVQSAVSHSAGLPDRKN